MGTGYHAGTVARLQAAQSQAWLTALYPREDCLRTSPFGHAGFGLVYPCIVAMKHTPGPWKARACPKLWAVDCTDMGGGPILHTDNEANARLIAAAPQMLEALMELRDAPWNSMCGRANQLVEDAINSAIDGSQHHDNVDLPDTAALDAENDKSPDAGEKGKANE